VKGAALDQATRPTGRFLLLPLPAGKHTVVLRNGRGGTRLRDVEIRYGRDGQPEGVFLGDVSIPTAAAIRGSVTSTLSLVDGLAVDGLTGATVRVEGGEFFFEGVPEGDHPITVSMGVSGGGRAAVGGPVVVRIGPGDSGVEKRLAAIPVRYASGGTGRVKVRLAAVGSLGGAQLSDFVVTGLPSSTLDSTGLLDVEASEGPYHVSVEGSAAGGVTFPPSVDAVVIAGEVVDLGTLYLTGDDAIAESANGCSSDTDCAPGTCIDHLCQGWTVPVVPPVGDPVCTLSQLSCTPGFSCEPQYASYSAACFQDGGGSFTACLQCGQCCTPDGVVRICADPCSTL
jgi:hypothetical protein